MANILAILIVVVVVVAAAAVAAISVIAVAVVVTAVELVIVIVIAVVMRSKSNSNSNIDSNIDSNQYSSGAQKTTRVSGMLQEEAPINNVKSDLPNVGIDTPQFERTAAYQILSPIPSTKTLPAPLTS